MKFDPDRHHRRSIRLAGFDYRQANAYFVTICTQVRCCLLGEIIDEVMHRSDAGRMVEQVWNELPERYPGVDVDAFVVMPNHIHGIIVLSGQAIDGFRGNIRRGDGHGTIAPSLADIVQRFKSYTTAEYRHAVCHLGWPPFPGKLWQRNYYEHIIRDAASLDTIRQYIETNVLQWSMDEENPKNVNTPQSGR